MDRAGWILLVMALLLASSCGRGPSSSQEEVKGGSDTTVYSKSDAISTFRLIGHTETGRKKWQIEGETADLLSETVILSPVTATSFGEVEVKLTSRQGTFNRETQDIHLDGDVVMTTTDQMKLTTDYLDWNANEEIATTSEWVTVTRPGMTVVGLGAVGYPNLKKVRLEKQITVLLFGENGETEVTCDGPLEVDYARHKARFWRNVWVEDTRGTIQSDRLDVTLNPQSGQIKKATFWGKVQIHHDSQIAYAERANYWQPSGRIQLMGHPKVVMLLGEGEEFEFE